MGTSSSPRPSGTEENGAGEETGDILIYASRSAHRSSSFLISRKVFISAAKAFVSNQTIDRRFARSLQGSPNCLLLGKFIRKAPVRLGAFTFRVQLVPAVSEVRDHPGVLAELP
jgi:hypothetical protein